MKIVKNKVHTLFIRLKKAIRFIINTSSLLKQCLSFIITLLHKIVKFNYSFLILDLVIINSNIL